MIDMSPLPNAEPTLILLTHAPTHPLTAQGYQLVDFFCHQYLQSYFSANAQVLLPPSDLHIFLYSDAVSLANRLIWLPADMDNMAKQWQILAKQFNLTIQVCVSAALARGVTDAQNAHRHALDGDNLAQGFELVGLGELAMQLHHVKQVYQF